MPPMDTDLLVHRRRLRSGIGLSNANKYANSGHPLDGMLGITVTRGVIPISGRFEFAMDAAYYAGPPQAGASGGFTLTEVSAGAANIFGVNVIPGGWSIRTDNATGDSEVLQLNGTPYRYTVGKSFAFLIGFSMNLAAGPLHFGMSIPDTTPIASAPTDGLFFAKAQAGVMTFNARKAGVASSVASVGVAMANDVEIYYAFTVSESGQVDVFSGPNPLALTHFGRVAAGNANIPNTSDLGLHIAVQAGTAASAIMTLRALVFGGDI